MPTQQWQRSIVVMCRLWIAIAIIGAMYWAQAVFIPLALAMLFTLVLTPCVTALHRLGISRVPAVILVVALASSVLFGLGWVMTRQFVNLAVELPAYSESIKNKVRGIKEWAGGGSSGKVGKLITEVAGELGMADQPLPPGAPAAAGTEGAATSKPSGKVAMEPSGDSNAVIDALAPAPQRPRILVQQVSNSWLAQLSSAMGTVGDSLATFALAIVLTIFMLLSREDLRDRLIRLIGNGRLTATTRALDDAVQRISRFLLMQVVVNGSYGIALAAGLLVLGVEYALLWGLLAALLRYIPYLGAWIAATPPILLSLVMSEGFMQPMFVIGWIVLIELVSNNVIEPLLYGRSMGVSTVALLASAAFWAFLWGPVGLVLSSPLTVCLVVLGKYVPQLEFIDILLGDEPALKPFQTLYQRLLARDADEAHEVALAQAQHLPPAELYDSLLVPAVSLFKHDLERGELDEQDEQYILTQLREIIDELGERTPAPTEPLDGVEPVRLLACPAHGEIDELALAMLRQQLDPRRWDLRVVGTEVLTGEVIDSVASQRVPLVCIASLAPGGLAQIRYLSKRLRGCHDDLKIVVGRWGAKADGPSIDGLLRQAGADDVEHTVQDTLQRLNAQWSLVASRRPSVTT